MKRILFAVAVIIFLSGFAGIGNELAVLDMALEKIRNSPAVELHTTGTSTGTAAGPLQVASHAIINFNKEIYKLNIVKSNSTGLLGKQINDTATRAKHVYYRQGDENIRIQERTHRNAVDENLAPDFANTEVTIMSRQEFEDKFQRDIFEFFYYDVSRKSVAKVTEKLSFNKKERTWSFCLLMKPEVAARLSKLEAMATGGLAQVDYTRLELSFVLDENMRLLTIKSDGVYVAKLSPPANVFGDQKTKIVSTTTIKYYDKAQPIKSH